MLAKEFAHLLNGGAAEVGVDGLAAAIRNIEAEQAECRRQLARIPDQRSEALLADNHDKSVDALEKRESALYWEIERGNLQISELRLKLAEHRSLGNESRIQFHRAELAEAARNVEAAVIAGIEANAAADRAFRLAEKELGRETANRHLSPVMFGGLLNFECFELWRANQEDQRRTIARRQSELNSPPPSRAPSATVQAFLDAGHITPMAVRIATSPPRRT